MHGVAAMRSIYCEYQVIIILQQLAESSEAVVSVQKSTDPMSVTRKSPGSRVASDTHDIKLLK